MESREVIHIQILVETKANAKQITKPQNFSKEERQVKSDLSEKWEKTWALNTAGKNLLGWEASPSPKYSWMRCRWGLSGNQPVGVGVPPASSYLQRGALPHPFHLTPSPPHCDRGLGRVLTRNGRKRRQPGEIKGCCKTPFFLSRHLYLSRLRGSLSNLSRADKDGRWHAVARTTYSHDLDNG